MFNNILGDGDNLLFFFLLLVVLFCFCNGEDGGVLGDFGGDDNSSLLFFFLLLVILFANCDRIGGTSDCR
ncbi:MAG: hypothetical protein K0Q97_60 [Bacillota bacterium]|jgi:hypothetical protein|nr:hypothetical protein [Bacillota bacterium]